jgi:hypothetical protein
MLCVHLLGAWRLEKGGTAEDCPAQAREGKCRGRGGECLMRNQAALILSLAPSEVTPPPLTGDLHIIMYFIRLPII